MQPNTVLYHTDDSDAGIADARAYIARFHLTGDDVRLIKKEGAVMVIAKREVHLCDAPKQRISLVWSKK